ncbi:hypothetical protein BC628DRAFT_238199 [Trametes gibbosa]|nr:hypothetical protein BC628DRAFT_238199 [Trametes gibbosa]
MLSVGCDGTCPRSSLHPVHCLYLPMPDPTHGVLFFPYTVKCIRCLRRHLHAPTIPALYRTVAGPSPYAVLAKDFGTRPMAGDAAHSRTRLPTSICPRSTNPTCASGLPWIWVSNRISLSVSALPAMRKPASFLRSRFTPAGAAPAVPTLRCLPPAQPPVWHCPSMPLLDVYRNMASV